MIGSNVSSRAKAMTNLHDLPFPELQFYATAPYGCSYLPNRVARSQVAAPNHLINPARYGELIKMGFRRSGLYTYRPACELCRSCIPVRLPVADFTGSRSQRRALARHADLIATQRSLIFREEHYALYQRYQSARHSGGGMDEDSRSQYTNFLLQTNIDTCLIEFRAGANGPVRMVSIIDLLPDGLSSVYTFYDPDLPGASLGTYGILWQIAQCGHLELPYLYLGYWIRHSQKMAYKAKFQPLEGFIDNAWRRLKPDDRL